MTHKWGKLFYSELKSSVALFLLTKQIKICFWSFFRRKLSISWKCSTSHRHPWSCPEMKSCPPSLSEVRREEWGGLGEHQVDCHTKELQQGEALVKPPQSSKVALTERLPGEEVLPLKYRSFPGCLRWFPLPRRGPDGTSRRVTHNPPRDREIWRSFRAVN